MSSSVCSAVQCEAELATGWFLCHDDTSTLEHHLGRVADVWGTIQATLERRDVGPESMGGGSNGGSVEPCNLSVLDDAFTLQGVLTGWAAQIPAMRPANREPHILAAWMLQPDTMALIRRQEWAADLMYELADALAPLSRAADRAAPKSFAGMCPTEFEDAAECGTPVYVRPGAPFARCHQCRADWDVTDWRARALEAAGHHAGTPAEVSRMVTNPATGEALPAATIRSWIRRGKLTPIDHNPDGKPIYQVRKVRKLWANGMAATYTRKLATLDKELRAA